MSVIYIYVYTEYNWQLLTIITPNCRKSVARNFLKNRYKTLVTLYIRE